VMTRKKFWNNDMEALFAIMIVLIILGTINVFSSSFILSEADYNTPYYFLKKHIINVIIGLIFFGIGFAVDYHRWRTWMPIILGATVSMLILVLIVGPSVNGAKRWLPLPFFQIQPAEIAKLVSIMMMAAYLAMCLKRRIQVTPLNWQTAIIGIMFVLTEKEPDMGTACIIMGVPLIMMMVAGMSGKWVGGLISVMVIGAIIMIMMQPYRLERVKVTWDPWADAQNVGYQTVQSLSAIGSGELWGMGLGVGVSKYDYLPEAHTDFAFAIFCQENGFIGALLVFMLFAAFTVYGARIANKAVDFYGQILATGILILIVGQAVANLLMVGGAFPVVGVPLPFISYGGTSLICTMAAVGILINVGRIGEREQGKREAEALERELEERATAEKERYSKLRLTRSRFKH